MSVISWPMLLPYVGTIVTGQRLRQALHGRPGRRWAHAWFLGFTLASLLASLSWFKDPMHDIALIFGSHGRWACETVNADGSPAYLLRDSTVPFMLFLPSLLAVAGHWLTSKRARA